MFAQKVLPVLVSILVIVIVSIVQERSRFLAAILSSMPLMAPLALWIVWSATRGDHDQTASFAASMIVGIIATLGFVVGVWAALLRHANLGWALASGAVVWLVVLAAGRFAQSVVVR